MDHLIKETHTAYESRYSVLQGTIKGLRRSLVETQSVDEIPCLTKDIYQQLFNPLIPTNQVVCAQMQTQFNSTFQKIDDLKRWFEEQADPASLKRGNNNDPNRGIRIKTVSTSELSKTKTPSIQNFQTPP